MKLFVTGANGFLGSAVVREASQRGHHVVAMVRDVGKYVIADGVDQASVTPVQGDLRAPGAWQAALVGCDAVLHLAANFTDFYTQFASTVQGTERLLAEMAGAGVKRLVHVSTFSIYDYRAAERNGVLDEDSPLEAHPEDLDDYTKTKLVQERLVNAFGACGGEVTSIRPGAIYGPNKMWSAGMTFSLGSKAGLAIGPDIAMKLTFVDNCAEAIVLAAETPAAIGETLNIVDDETPTMRQFAAAMKQAGFDVPMAVPLPFGLVRTGASLLDKINRKRYNGRAKIPWYAVPAKLDQRFKPLRYPNAKAKRLLGWTPRFNLEQGVAESLRRERQGAGKA